MSYAEKPDWQKSLEHHEELCTERYKSIHNMHGVRSHNAQLFS